MQYVTTVGTTTPWSSIQPNNNKYCILNSNSFKGNTSELGVLFRTLTELLFRTFCQHHATVLFLPGLKYMYTDLLVFLVIN